MSKKQKPTLQDLKKANTEIKILQVLTEEKKPIRWHDLLKKTGVSTRTLSDRVQDLQKTGAVRRIIDQSEYPPAVFYEATSSSHLFKLPIGLSLRIIQGMKEAKKEVYEEMVGFSDSAERTIDMTIDNYIVDLLFTLRYCLENPESQTPHLINFHVNEYMAQIESLVHLWRNKPELIEVIKTIQNRVMSERKEFENKVLEKYASQFKDKDFAKPIIGLFAIYDARKKTKSIFDFLKELEKSKELQQELEKRFRLKVDKERLEAILKEKAWNNLVFAKPESEERHLKKR